MTEQQAAEREPIQDAYNKAEETYAEKQPKVDE